jgi:hypothetical protein
VNFSLIHRNPKLPFQETINPNVESMYGREDFMSDLSDDDLLWLIERALSDYLTWIGLWLVCLLGIVSILIVVASTPNFPLIPAHLALVLSTYWGLVFGMIFSVYRVTNILMNHMKWARKIKKRSLRNEIVYNTRGALSLFFIDYEGKICRSNRYLAWFVHIAVFGILYYLAAF